MGASQSSQLVNSSLSGKSSRNSRKKLSRAHHWHCMYNLGETSSACIMEFTVGEEIAVRIVFSGQQKKSKQRLPHHVGALLKAELELECVCQGVHGW